MSDFFSEAPPPEPADEPDHLETDWLRRPSGMLAGVVPFELIIGRSPQAVVTLIGMRAFPTGLAMTLGVAVRKHLRHRDLNAEVFDGPYRHDRDEAWLRGRLKWGFELSDGIRVTNLDLSWMGDVSQRPEHPVLSGGSGGGDDREVEREYWLWPLPPAGSTKVICQWLDFGISQTTQRFDTTPMVEAAKRAAPLWPSTPADPSDN